MHPIFDCDFVLVIPYVEQEGTGAAGRSVRDASALVLAHAVEHEGHGARAVDDVVDHVAAVRFKELAERGSFEWRGSRKNGPSWHYTLAEVRSNQSSVTIVP